MERTFRQVAKLNGEYLSFASSLTTAIPEPLPVDAMPTFTVLVPHYSEKILLSLREIIREEDRNTRVTLLEYLKQLHPVEWDNFVKDTKILADEAVGFTGIGSSPIWRERREGQPNGRSSVLLHRLQDGVPGVHSSYKDLGVIACSDLVQNCVRHDELLEGHQAALPRRKSGGRQDVQWQHR